MKNLIAILMLLMTTETALANTITVEAPYITLADLFPDVPEKLASTRVMMTPQPGSSITLNQQWLGAVAKKYNLTYTPSISESIKVVGASEIVPVEDVEQMLKDHLTQILKNDAFSIKLDNADVKIHFPKGKPGNILVTAADVNSQQTRFTATLVLQHDGTELNRIKVAGRIMAQSSVPVLNRIIHRGETIQPEDVEWQNVPSAQVNQSTILDEATLVGATSKRQDLLPNRAINKHEISIPYMVLKNQAVTIIASSPYINITAKGKAMENGGKDAYVKVMNVSSQKIIHATVIGPQRVRVDIPQAHTVTSME